MNDNNIEISGTFSENFLLKILLKTIDSISTDFSTSKIMLYFYENSNEINIYFNKYLINLGDYSFQTYISFNSTNTLVQSSNLFCFNILIDGYQIVAFESSNHLQSEL